MADSSTVVVIDHTDKLNLSDPNPKGGRQALQKVINLLKGLASGNKRGVGVDIFPDGSEAKPGVAHITLASCAANTVIEINGAPFTAITGSIVSGNDEFDIDGTDAADATDLARAINASTHAAISGLVKAVAPAYDKLTAATAVAGDTFVVTLADGTVHRFVGQAGASTVGSKHFSIDTGDTETATDIAAQVNGYAPFTDKLAASSSSAVVTFRSLDGNTFTLAGTATTLAESGGATVTVSAIQKGGLGNAITVKTLGVVANGSVAYSSASGTQTVTINGVQVHSAAVGATDAATAAAVASSINSSTDALVQGHVRALVRSATVYIFASRPGAQGNAITLAASGTGATASGARLTGGTEASSNGVRASGTVTVSGADGGAYVTTINGVAINATGTNGNDTTTAASIAAAINSSTDALVQGIVYASSSSGTVTISAVRGGLSGNTITLAATGTGATASAARLTSGANPTTVVVTNATSASRSIGADRASNGAGGAATKVAVVLGAAV